MKVLIVSDAWKPQINGVVRTYEYLQEELIRMGHDCTVVGPADFPVRISMPGYAEIDLALFARTRLWKKIDKFAPCHLHIATEGPLGWSARAYALRHGLDFSTSYHTHFPDYAARRVPPALSFLRNAVKNRAIRFVRDFHAPSHVMMTSTASLESTLKSWDFSTPMHRLTRGVNIDLFRPGEKTLFQSLAPPVALYVGRVAIEKSVDAFLAMPWKGSKVIIGSGPDQTTLQRKFPDAHFPGAKEGEELAACYRSADLFVFPSRTDTFGMVLIEALASGLPVAGYPVTGPADIITEPILGALDSDLATAAQKAMAAPGTPQARYEHVRHHYTWERMALQFLEAIPDWQKNKRQASK